MRILLGMILGAALTVGVAYLHDSGTVSSATTGPATATAVEQRNMVNWDVVEHNWRHVRQRVHDTWSGLSQKMSG